MIFSLFEIIKFYLNSTYPAADLNFVQDFFYRELDQVILDFGRFWVELIVVSVLGRTEKLRKYHGLEGKEWSKKLGKWRMVS